MRNRFQFLVSFVSGDHEYGMWVHNLLEFADYTVTGGSDLATLHPEILLSTFSYAERLVPVLSSSVVAAPEQEYWELLYLSNPGYVLPVLVGSCDIPGFLGEVDFIDMTRSFRSKDAANEYFLGRIDAALRGTGWPNDSPPFPG